MKKILYSALCIAALSVAGCSDFLDVTSTSEVDGDFVFSNSTTARAAMDGAYDTWRSCASTQVFGAGWFYALDAAGSDIERHPELWTNQPDRHWPESLYDNGTYAGSYSLTAYNDGLNKAYNSLYAVIGKANAVITAMEEASNFEEIVGKGEPSELGQLYGEAIAMRATAYRELCKYYGDVPYNAVFGETANGLTSRDLIYEKTLDDLIRVEPLMYEVGAIPGYTDVKKYFSKTYVQGLIGRMALEAGGYQTRRQDIERVDKDGKTIAFESLPGSTPNNGAVYGRRTDWQDFYTLAKTYFGKVIASSGSARLVTEDPRKTENGRSYDNPYQYFFHEMHMSDAAYATESIYEYPMQQGSSSNERSYSSGRPSGGGGSKAYPCKAYGQCRINPAFYYGCFDPKDKRRDVSATVTGSNGSGVEVLLPFAPGSTCKGGGIALNKWDENRQPTPWWQKNRLSGINGPYMRMSEIYLGYAEACAALGDEGEAKAKLTIIRERAFPAGQANVDAFITKCGSLLKAVIEERGFEFAGEGDRRWTLIRTGLLPEKIRAIKELTAAMIDGLEQHGSYTFENGNVISDYVYTKSVDAKTDYGYRLTTQCTDETDPVLFPGWRGQHDDWSQFGCKYADNPKTNLAIKGLFAPVSETEADLQADEYTKVEWGKALVTNKKEYHEYLFYNYDYVSAPIYLVPFGDNTLSSANLTNGYGFKNN